MAFVLGECDVWLHDNIVLDRSGAPGTVHTSSVNVLNEKPLWSGGLTAIPAADVLDTVLTNAGAFPARRDAIDRRIVDSVRKGVDKTIDSQEQVGGYPKHQPVRRSLTIPDGNIDAWLAEFPHESSQKSATGD